MSICAVARQVIDDLETADRYYLVYAWQEKYAPCLTIVYRLTDTIL